jgi:hypothetical protein
MKRDIKIVLYKNFSTESVEFKKHASLLCQEPNFNFLWYLQTESSFME